MKKEYIKKLVSIVTVLCMLTLFSGGCGGAADPAEGVHGNEERETPETPETCEIPEPSETPETRTEVVDQAGRELVVDGIPQRIVSLSPGNTELACALGLEERLVGVTDYCNYPPQAVEKPKIGGFSEPNVEQIVALEPELVLAGNMHPDETERLEEMGIAVLVLSPETLDEIYVSLELLAQVTGCGEAFSRLSAEMKGRIGALEEALATLECEERVRVYFEIYSDPLMSAGNRAIIHEVITLAGGSNIFADLDDTYPTVSSEAVVNRDPQVIFFPNDHGTEEFLSGQLQERPGWGNISAIVHERLHGVDNDVFSRPGPRIVDAVEEAAKLFYPALFE